MSIIEYSYRTYPKKVRHKLPPCGCGRKFDVHEHYNRKGELIGAWAKCQGKRCKRNPDGVGAHNAEDLKRKIERILSTNP